MNPRLKLLLLFQTLPLTLLSFTLVGYFIESYTSYTYWDGTKTVYMYFPPGVALQDLVDGITFVAFFFVVGAVFSAYLIWTYDQECKEEAAEEEEKLRYA